MERKKEKRFQNDTLSEGSSNRNSAAIDVCLFALTRIFIELSSFNFRWPFKKFNIEIFCLFLLNFRWCFVDGIRSHFRVFTLIFLLLLFLLYGSIPCDIHTRWDCIPEGGSLIWTYRRWLVPCCQVNADWKQKLNLVHEIPTYRHYFSLLLSLSLALSLLFSLFLSCCLSLSRTLKAIISDSNVQIPGIYRSTKTNVITVQPKVT